MNQVLLFNNDGDRHFKDRHFIEVVAPGYDFSLNGEEYSNDGHINYLCL